MSVVGAHVNSEDTSVSKIIADHTATYTIVLDQAHTLLAQLDVFTAFAYVAYNAAIPYTKPKILPLGEESANLAYAVYSLILLDELVLEDLRHPVLESLPGVVYIPNSIKMTPGSLRIECI